MQNANPDLPDTAGGTGRRARDETAGWDRPVRWVGGLWLGLDAPGLAARRD